LTPAKIENVFLEVNTNQQGIIKKILAGKFAIEEFVLETSIFETCPFLFGTLDLLPEKESFLMEGMIIVSKENEYNVDLELFKDDDKIIILIHNRTSVYKVVKELNQNRNDLFFMKREISEKNKELAILRKASDKANEEKSRFLAIMSHEVRNPLNTILGYTSMIAEENLSDKVREYVGYLVFSGKNLKVIVDDILDLSRIEAGKLELAFEEINVNQIVENNFISFKNQHKNEFVALEIAISDKIPEILIGDGVRIYQVLANLINNAIKFTKEGKISIQTEIISENKKTAEIRFKISDTGRGMTDEQTVKIFEEYRQTELDDNRVFGGAGLGLSIVKRLVSAMNGSITVASELNVGSTFSVEIPFQKVLKASKKPVIENEKLILKSLKGKRILLADDDLLNQKITSYILNKEDVLITIVKNGLEALEVLNTQDFDIAILDINMPELPGDYLILQKANFKKNNHIPYLALTGNATQEHKENYLKIGFTDVIFKPYKFDELIGKIERCF
jgi:signal transduction histidine kinase/CheY-like chemotaxis protein